MKTKSLIFIFLFILLSCDHEDITPDTEIEMKELNLAIDNSKQVSRAEEIKFATNEYGELLSEIPPEILKLMIEDFTETNDYNKIKLLKNTYNLKSGKLTELAAKDEIYLKSKLNINSIFNSRNVGHRAHVADLGWLPWTRYNQIIGTTGQRRQLEAIEFGNIPGPVAIIGRAHVEGLGWINQGTSRILGTTGQGRRMEAIKLYIAKYYRVHVKNLGWLPWVRRGQVAGTTGQSRRIEAFQLFNFIY